jgi:hypothetical protein
MSKIQLLKSAVWNDASELGPTLSFDNKMKLRIPDQGTWIKWREDPEKNIPHCILQYLHGKYGDEMELRCPEERYLVGESVIVEDISKDGARILITKHMQSELAFAVTRTDVVAFNKTDFILQGQPYEYTQYCCDLPKNFMENMLYPFVSQIPPGNSRKIGDMVAYHAELKTATLFTARIFRNAHQARAPLKTVTVPSLDGEITIFCGKGFQTTDTLGVVMEIDDSGVITKWRELWNQDYFTRAYPHVLKSLRPFFVFETDKERSNHVRSEHIQRVFNVMPAALASPQDMHGRGAVFIVGVVSLAGQIDMPISLHGVRAMCGEELLKILYDHAVLIQNETVESYISQVMCAIEDGLHAAADYKAESSKSLSPIEIRMSGQICMALLYKLTQPNQRKVHYESNNLTVEYSNWGGLEPIMGRNASETTLSDGCVFIAGQPKFKWMILPYSRLVLSLKDFKLLSRGRTAAHLDTTAARRLEYNSKLVDGKYCKVCLRKKECTCP